MSPCPHGGDRTLAPALTAKLREGSEGARPATIQVGIAARMQCHETGTRARPRESYELIEHRLPGRCR
jgi:hypothetical protein